MDGNVTMMLGGRPENCMSIPCRGSWSRPALGTIQAPTQWEHVTTFPGVKEKGREPAEVKNKCGYTSSNPYVLMPCTRIH